MCALDSGSVSKAVLTLTAANYMTAANSGQMLVFQPSLVTNSLEEPKVPKGSMVMYTSQVMAGKGILDFCGRHSCSGTKLFP